MKKKRIKIYIPLMVVSALILFGGVRWYLDYARYIKTEDAFVTSNAVTVSPKIMGRIGRLFVEEGDSVRKGQLLAELDSADLLAQKHQVETGETQSQAGLELAEAKYDYDRKSTEVLRIALQRAKEDQERGKAQFSGGVIPKEQYDHLQKALESAQAQYNASLAQVLVSGKQVKSAKAAIQTAGAQIGVINTQLGNTKLYAPTDGLVAKRWLLAGDIANVGQSVYTINDNGNYWITVYLEETNVNGLKIGQDAIFTLDTYPGVTFNGKIFMLGSSTASQFSLIPASNASGNFTKVTQRVPIKISIDGVSGGKKLSAYRMLTGMSAVVKIVR